MKGSVTITITDNKGNVKLEHTEHNTICIGSVMAQSGKGKPTSVHLGYQNIDDTVNRYAIVKLSDVAPIKLPIYDITSRDSIIGTESVISYNVDSEVQPNGDNDVFVINVMALTMDNTKFIYNGVTVYDAIMAIKSIPDTIVYEGDTIKIGWEITYAK